MNSFKDVETVNDLLKKAELELLLDEVVVSGSDGISVYPVTCPGKGRKNDHGKDEKGRPACIFNNNSCPYLISAHFRLDDFVKQIRCMVEGA